MNSLRVLSIGILGAWALAATHRNELPQKLKTVSECCSVVEQALRAVEDIKKGEKRAEIEKEFALEGGLDFRTESIYTFKLCPMIKVRIQFLIDPNEKRKLGPNTANMNPDSPNDTVESVGQPYLQFPVRD